MELTLQKKSKMNLQLLPINWKSSITQCVARLLCPFEEGKETSAMYPTSTFIDALTNPLAKVCQPEIL